MIAPDICYGVFFMPIREESSFMKELDLKKNDIDNFEKSEETEISYDTWEQDIIRCWRFLKATHTLENRSTMPELYSWEEHNYNSEDGDLLLYNKKPDNECVCIRALIDHKKTKRKCGNHEHIIRSFDETGFWLFWKFVKKHLFHRDAVYNLFYNIYKVDCVKGECFRRATGYKMIGRRESVTSTNLLAVDLDAYSFDEYKDIRKLFLDRGIIPIEISSGHGFHLLVKIETCTDKGLLAKWLQVMSDYNINVDQHCKDPGRVYRLPFFYNVKSAKYDTVTKAGIIEGEYGVPTYTVEDIFQRFGYDYKNWDRNVYDVKSDDTDCNASVNETNTKSVMEKKKADIQQRYYKIPTEEELVSLYPMLDIAVLPEGIRSMLKGFIEGYTYYQLMCVVLFFKRSKYSLEQIKDIVTIAESINGNDWNSWDAVEKAEYFYHNIYGMSMEELDNLETEFGSITFPAYDNGLKVPLGIMKPNELKLYLYLLRYGESRKKDITSFLHISANKLDRIMDSAMLIKKDGLKYNILDKKVKNYIYLSKEELDSYLQWNENEIAVYLYLKFRCGDDDSIQTSIDSIEKAVFLSHATVTKVVQILEGRKLISVKRKEEQHHLIKELRESNIYKLLE